MAIRLRSRSYWGKKGKSISHYQLSEKEGEWFGERYGRSQMEACMTSDLKADRKAYSNQSIEDSQDLLRFLLNIACFMHNGKLFGHE